MFDKTIITGITEENRFILCSLLDIAGIYTDQGESWTGLTNYDFDAIRITSAHDSGFGKELFYKEKYSLDNYTFCDCAHAIKTISSLHVTSPLA